MTLSATDPRYYPSPCIQMPGPPGNVYPATNSVEGAICHSAEGDWADSYTPVDTMIQRGVSWHFSVFKDGRVWQHYPLDASCWHSGTGVQNRRLVGIEHEGKGPLTEAQVAASVALVKWIAATAGWPLTRHETLLEHNEVYNTTCPSGRIPWERYLVLPNGEFLPEPDEGDAAAFYRAAMLGPQPDSEIIPIPPEREGWAYWKFGVKR